MPIRIQKDLPAREILEHENIFVMDEDRAIHQDIRPLEILILNLMPTKEETELQLLRLLSNSPLQVNVTFLIPASHESKHTSKHHLNRFYCVFDEISHLKFDGMIITGAPLEQWSFEEVDFWEELVKIFDWSEDHVTSVMYQCWATQAALYYYYGIQKRYLDHKLFGVFPHEVAKRKIPLVRGFDDIFYAPHSRHTESPLSEIKKCEKIIVLGESEEAGFLMGISEEGRKIFVQGHPEYDRMTLDGEYRRDLNKGLDIQMPVNYYPDNDPDRRPLLQWRAMSANLYTNWLNYYVYQTTPFNLMGTPGVFK